jgi:hypothetical protein
LIFGMTGTPDQVQLFDWPPVEMMYLFKAASKTNGARETTATARHSAARQSA